MTTEQDAPLEPCACGADDLWIAKDAPFVITCIRSTCRNEVVGNTKRKTRAMWNAAMRALKEKA